MNKKVKSTAEESMELAALLESKPQIDQKIKYYEGVLKLNEKIYNSIQERIKKGCTVKKSLIFGFIPIKTKKILDSLDVSRLEREMKDIEDTTFNHGQYYKNWIERKKSYEFKFDEITRECNSNFDKVLESAKEIKSNVRLVREIEAYNNKENDQTKKNTFYLYLKQEINNNQVLGRKR